MEKFLLYFIMILVYDKFSKIFCYRKEKVFILKHKKTYIYIYIILCVCIFNDISKINKIIKSIYQGVKTFINIKL